MKPNKFSDLAVKFCRITLQSQVLQLKLRSQKSCRIFYNSFLIFYARKKTRDYQKPQYASDVIKWKFYNVFFEDPD